MNARQIASDVLAVAPTNNEQLKQFDFLVLLGILEFVIPIVLECIKNWQLKDVQNPGFFSRARLRLLLMNNVDRKYREAISLLLTNYSGKLTEGLFNELVKKTS